MKPFNIKFYNPSLLISNKCFIHSPAGVIPKIIVFGLYWQQDFQVWIYRGGIIDKTLIRYLVSMVFIYGGISIILNPKSAVGMF
jgi:hypothetical protein